MLSLSKNYLKSYLLKLTLGLTPIFLQLNALGQSKGVDRYMESLWGNINVLSTNESVIVSDTMVLICTTRKFNPLALRKFGDNIDSSMSLHYILSVRKDNKWNLYKFCTLDSAAAYLNKNKNLVIYTEGMGKTFTTNMYRGAGLSLQYDVNVIMFDYPSAKPSYSLIRNFSFALKTSSIVYRQYVEFILILQKYKKDGKDWINNSTTVFHHSMGNRIIEKAFTSGELNETHKNVFNSIILNAPCVKQRNYLRWAEKIKLGEKLYVIYNKKDAQLRWAKLLMFSHLLGINPKIQAKGINYINMEPMAGSQHNAFLKNPLSDSRLITSYEKYRLIFSGR